MLNIFCYKHRRGLNKIKLLNESSSKVEERGYYLGADAKSNVNHLRGKTI